MKSDLDDLLKSTYQKGETPTDALNQTILRLVKERDAMKQKELKTNTAYQKETEKSRNWIKPQKNHWVNYSAIRKFVTVAAVFAIVVLMGAGVVHAAGKFFGIDYFWKLYGQGDMTEEVKKLLDDDPVVKVKKDDRSTDIVDFKVSSVLCDSEYVVLTMDVQVKDEEKYFLVTGVTDLTDPVSSMSLGIESKQTIAEYCRDNELQPVQVHTKLNKQSEKFLHIISRDNKQAGTGNGSLIICAERLTDDKSFTMEIKTSVCLSTGEEVSNETGDTLQIDVKDKSTEQSAYYCVDENDAYHVPDTAITIEEVKLKTTEVGTYSEITYVDDSTSEDPSVDWLFLCDKNGEMLECNVIAVGTCRSKGENVYVAGDCYKSIGLPDTIYVSIGDLGKVVELKKIEK